MIKPVICILLSIVATGVSWDDVILPPKPDATADTVPEAVLYFAQGAEILTKQYTPLMEKLQLAVRSNFKLWVAIPQCPANVAAIPGGLKSGINRVRTEMEKRGMNASHNFYSGHSLGGAMIPDYVVDNDKDADAVVLLASFLTRKYKEDNEIQFKVPVLTIGGDLDGLCRITRIAEAIYTQNKTLPVTVVNGASHMSFASGEPPKFVKDNDLKPELSEADAQDLIVSDMAEFLTGIIRGDKQAENVMKKRVDEAKEKTGNIREAFLMEGYVQFLPPCFCEAVDEYGGLQYGTCVTNSSCLGGVQWTSHAQEIMAGTANTNININSTDSIHLVTEERPSCHLPHIHGGGAERKDNSNPGADDGENTPPICDGEESECLLSLSTVTQQVYQNSGELDLWRLRFSVPSFDTGFLPQSAKELRVKMKSRQSIHQAAGIANVSFNELDGDVSICMEINQAAIDYAIGLLSEDEKRRWEESGKDIVVGGDKNTCAAGPCWIWDPLDYEEDEENRVVVKGVKFATENKNKYPCGEQKLLPCSSGMHYCKLLSPARALEWILVDSLK